MAEDQNVHPNVHEETLKRSEERLQMAEIVYAFTRIMGQYTNALDHC
ncbi:MAG TPA: hypothetical protein VLL25_03165 [Acidimicrobiales bacterium]|nr:hypothetical protein [Acidimicrobiales bacterium]